MRVTPRPCLLPVSGQAPTSDQERAQAAQGKGLCDKDGIGWMVRQSPDELAPLPLLGTVDRGRRQPPI